MIQQRLLSWVWNHECSSCVMCTLTIQPPDDLFHVSLLSFLYVASHLFSLCSRFVYLCGHLNNKQQTTRMSKPRQETLFAEHSPKEHGEVPLQLLFVLEN